MKSSLLPSLTGLALLLLVCIVLANNSVAQSTPHLDDVTKNKIKVEADYILKCQYNDANDATNSANGAINNQYGAPTYVVPSENARPSWG